jgi:hypothetical protein
VSSEGISFSEQSMEEFHGGPFYDPRLIQDLHQTDPRMMTN